MEKTILKYSRLKLFIITLIFSMPILLSINSNPLQAPDEYSHFRRAAEIALLDPSVIKTEFKTKSIRTYGYTLSDINLGESRKSITGEMKKHKARSFISKQRTLKHNKAFNPAATYSRFAYLPQSAAFWLHSQWNGSLFDAYKLGNELSGLILIGIFAFLADKVIASNSNISYLFLAPFSSLPMVAYLCTSWSADSGVIIGSLIGAITIVEMNTTFSKAGNDSKYKESKIIALSLLLFLSSLMIAAKAVYIVISIWQICIIAMNSLTLKGIPAKVGCLSLAGGGAAALAARVHNVYIFRNNLSISSSETNASIVDFLQRTFQSLAFQAEFYYKTLVGVFGPLTIYMSDLDYSLIAVLLILLLMSSHVAIKHLSQAKNSKSNVHSQRFQASLIAVITLTFFSIFYAMYSAWSTETQPFIGGIQGRYFLPLIPYIIVAITSNINIKSGYAVENMSNQILQVPRTICLTSCVIFAIISIRNFSHLLY